MRSVPVGGGRRMVPAVADLPLSIHVTSARAKRPASLRSKCRRKRYVNPAVQVTDLLAVRVITYFKDDLDAVATRLRTAVQVSVKVQKLNPTAQVIYDNKLTLDHTGHEKTAVRFWLDAAGKVIDVQERQKSLMETFRRGWANGADLDPKTGVRMPRRE